jgi:hypothetical protein
VAPAVTVGGPVTVIPSARRIDYEGSADVARQGLRTFAKDVMALDVPSGRAGPAVPPTWGWVTSSALRDVSLLRTSTTPMSLAPAAASRLRSQAGDSARAVRRRNRGTLGGSPAVSGRRNPHCVATPAGVRPGTQHRATADRAAGSHARTRRPGPFHHRIIPCASAHGGGASKQGWVGATSNDFSTAALQATSRRRAASHENTGAAHHV